MSMPNSKSGRRFIILFATLTVFKILLAATLPMLGDEAFYWQESRALAWSYSDVPPMTAAMIAAGTTVAGNGLMGVRWPFLFLGAMLPWLLRYWAYWRLADIETANRIGMYALLLPFAGLSGVLALPDVPLTFAMLFALVFLDMALDSNRWRDWIGFGLAVAISLLSHWRGLLLFAVGLALLLWSERGRQALINRRCWLAMLIAITGLIPIFLFNLANDWTALRFQALERNPWQFQIEGLWIPVEQALVVTPVLFCMLIVIIMKSWQQRQKPPHDLLLASAAGILAVYFLLGWFADNVRMRLHWPLPGYLPLLLLAPALERQWLATMGWRRVMARYAWLSVAVFMLALLCVLAVAASPSPEWRARAAVVLGDGFNGWDIAAAETERQLSRLPEDSILVADNFLLAAQLDFAFSGAREVFVLDHPRNIKHGRQYQLALWQRDEASLQHTQWQQGLLVIEEAALYAIDRLPAWQSLCDRFGSVHWLGEKAIGNSGQHFLFAKVTPRDGTTGRCDVPLIAYIDAPKPNQKFGSSQPIIVSGWAVRDDMGVASVKIWMDGKLLLPAQQGSVAAHVKAQWPYSRDPAHPNVGFFAQIDSAQLSPGRHNLEIEVSDGHGMVRRFGPRPISVKHSE